MWNSKFNGAGFWLWMAFLCLLCGCARFDIGTVEITEAEQEITKAEKPLYDFRSRTAVPAREIAEGKEYRITACQPYKFSEDADMSEQYFDCVITNDFLTATVIRLHESADPKKREKGERDVEYFLFTMDGKTGAQEFVKPAPALEKIMQEGELCAACDGSYYFAQYDYDKDPGSGKYTLKSCNLVQTDVSGTEIRSVDLTEGCRELDLMHASEGTLSIGCIRVDREGCCYLLDQSVNAKVLCVVRPDGSTAVLEDFRKSKNYLVAGIAGDGTPLFARSDRENGAWVFFFADGESGEEKEIGRIPAFRANIWQFSLGSVGICHYLTSEKEIVRWDLSSGVQEKIYDLRSAGILNQIQIATTGEGALHLYASSGEQLDMIALNEKGMEEAEEKTILKIWTADPIYIGSNPLRETAAVFSRNHTEISVEFLEVNTDDSQREMELNRVYAQTLEGKGPDILVLSPDEMDLFWEKGLLRDMEEYVPQEIRQDLLPKVWESGKRKGGYAGLCEGYLLLTLLTGEGTWEKEHWDIMDIVEILEQDKVRYLRTGHGMETGESGGANVMENNLIELLCWNGMKNTPFLDLERGKAYFQGEEFKRLLRQVKRYQNMVYDSEKGIYVSLIDGESLFYKAEISRIEFFSEMMEAEGLGCVRAGYPDGENGTYFIPGNYLVVGACAENTDAIREFIACYLEHKDVGYCLRESSLKEYVKKLTNDNWGIDTGEEGKKKPNKEKCVENYIELLRTCAYAAVVPDEIRVILSEEVGKYFADGQDLERTCALIQNRVQLYLNEK